VAQFLLELLSEEIPARMQPGATDDLKRLAAEVLEAARLDFDEMHAYAGPRRLALLVEGLPDAQPDVVEERRGPRADAPEKALRGFLKGNGLTPDQCEKRTTDKGEFWFATLHHEGRPTADVVGGMVTDLIGRLPWPKSMRWGAGAFRWVRPLRRVLCVLDGHAVPLEIGDGVPCGNVTEGHRFMSPDAFEVGFFDDYEKTLQLNKVIVKAAVRRRLIEQRAAALAAAEGLAVRRDAGLLAEVAGLVEWPVPLIGAIDEAFMGLPSEVLTTSMRTHQKYFALERPDGALASRFIVIANIESDDKGAAIIAGNERVLRARLSDARFFWDQDRKASLDSRVPALGRMVFHHRLGTLEDKVARLQALAADIAPSIPDADRDLVRRAATLAKADLTTGMVGEFPELQGVMGRYYALEEGEADAVADAIAEHYAPRGPNDFCPQKPVSLALSLADKIDTLVGFFAIGETPTGSRDPYALRRAALGVIRMVLENQLRLKLAGAFATALGLYGERAGDGDADEAVAALLEFFADRLKVHLRDRGMAHDLISAVFAVRKPDGGVEDDLVRLVARAEALKKFLDTEDGANLLAAHKRASNIVAIEEKKDKVSYAGDATGDLLTQTEEKALFGRLVEMGPAIRPAIDGERFDEAMGLLAELRAPVDQFFDQVTVNCEQADLRANRLRLLSKIRDVMGEIADFAHIEG